MFNAAAAEAHAAFGLSGHTARGGKLLRAALTPSPDKLAEAGLRYPPARGVDQDRPKAA